MKMIKSRTLTSHTYNENIADEITKDIFHIYYNDFLKLQATFFGLKEKEQNEK